jgi:hypothetical protein
MNETNIITNGSGTASDPYTFNFHTTGQSYGHPSGFHAVAIFLGLGVIVGFLLGFYFGKKQKKSN